LEDLPEKRVFTVMVIRSLEKSRIVTERGETDFTSIRNPMSDNILSNSELAQVKAELATANRALQIEASLERIRRVTADMEDPSDLIEVVKQIRMEVDALYGDSVIEVGLMQEADEETFRFWSILDVNEVPEDLALFGLLYPRNPDPPHPMLDRVWGSNGSYSLLFFDLEEMWKIVASLERYSPEEAEMMKPVMESGKIEGGWQTVSTIHVGRMYLGWLNDPPEELATVQPRIAAVLSEAQKRVEELKTAQQMRREAEIALAVEKVRARATAMRKSDELVEVADVLRTQIESLGAHGVMACSIYTRTAEGGHRASELAQLGEGSQQFSFDWLFDPKDLHPDMHVHEVLAAKDYIVLYLDKEAMDLVTSESIQFDEDYSEDFQGALDEAGLSELWISVAPLKSIRLCIDFDRKPVDEMEAILPLMASAFGLAFTRFEDLQLAEAQTREAQIEAVLERVRGQAMAMRTSDDVRDVIRMSYDEIKQLDESLFWVSFYTYDPLEQEMISWPQMPGLESLRPFRMPRIDHPFHDRYIDAFENQIPFYTYRLEGEEKATYDPLLFSETEFKNLPHDMLQLMSSMPLIISNNAIYRTSLLQAATTEELGSEAKTLLQRFAPMFDLTYTRYRDLQKTEAQAREAQIESALERVRSRSMAMHNSDELMDVAQVLFQQLIVLGMDPEIFETCGFVIFQEGTKIGDTFLTQLDGSPLAYTFSAEYGGDRATRQHFAAWEEGKAIEMVHLVGEQLPEHLTYLAEQSGKPVDRFHEIAGIETPPESFNYSANFKHGYVAVITTVPMEEAEVLYPRFAKVFEQAYTRFLDLKKAEAQTREAKIEAALERVRGRAMSMQKPTDLGEVSVLMFDELAGLGIQSLRSGISLPLENERYDFRAATTNEEGLTVLVNGNESINVHPIIRRAYEGWQAQEAYQQTVLTGEDLVEYYHAVFDTMPLPDWQDRMKTGAAAKEAFATFSFVDGWLYSFGSDAFDEGQIDIYSRFAKVFGLAFQRYHELTKAEKDYQALLSEKAKTEQALTILQSTQKQLVEQEKLASLGSLTAGIAHEIKNPLNFVNNFAEVSVEMAEELRDAIKAGRLEEAVELIGELMENAAQIAKHGKRADSIVKAMMQHARGGASDQETIQVNQFLEEYSNLAWHGMRARDHGFSAELLRDFDPEAGSSTVMPQELGRVVLNLLNNAFDAVKAMEAGEVTIRSARTKDGLTISVSDNGPGIPDAIRDKIFEPFFTTKATGEGTGLGLSLSYDIITKGHGGTMTVSNSEHGGALFTISIPANDV